MNIAPLKLAIRQLTPKQRAKLHDFLLAQIAADQARQESPHSRITYRQEFVRCGKQGCKCSGGKLHGPYFYAYWSEDGVTKSRYVGKKLPKGERI